MVEKAAVRLLRGNVDVVGIRAFLSELRAVDGAFPPRMREAHRKAAELVEPTIVANAPHGATGKVAGSFHVLASQRSGRVESRHPAAGVLNFGGVIRHAGHGHQREHLIQIHGTEYATRALAAHERDVEQVMDQAIDKLSQEAGFK